MEAVLELQTLETVEETEGADLLLQSAISIGPDCYSVSCW
jgi:hypothetical protein